MSAPQAREPHVERFVLAIGSGAALVYGLAIAIAATSLTLEPPTPLVLLELALLAGAYVGFQLFAFEFKWKDHWLTANLDEAVLFLALLLLPTSLPLLLIPLAETAMHATTRRPLLKSVFNVAQLTLACAAAWDLFVIARALGAPPILAAILGVPVYVLTSNLLLAGIFARLEGERTFRVYAQRFAQTTLVLSLVGIAGGLTIYALASIHPLAILAAVPFGYLLHRNTELSSRADRELAVHRRLADASASLVDKWDLDVVAAFVLDTCEGALPAGRAELKLAGPPERSWARDFEGGARPGAPGLEVAIPGREGDALGTLTVYPRPGQAALGEAERALVRVVAGQAAAAVLNVRSVHALEDAHRRALAQQERLAKQEKLSSLGMLVANVAHEIGNPLSYLRLSVETLKVHAKRLHAHDDPRVRATSESLLAGIATAQKGVESVVDISTSLRSVARQGVAGHRSVDVNAIARDVANVVRVGAPKSVRVVCEPASEPLLVNANAGELTQVLLNLAKNAAEAIGESDGHVTLRTRADADRVLVLVEDDGPGIAPEVQARLFEAFQTTKEQGTGIGLHISHGIVRAHGGDLRCTTTLGRGTTFTVDLPALAAAPPVAVAATPVPLPTAREGPSGVRAGSSLPREGDIVRA